MLFCQPVTRLIFVPPDSLVCGYNDAMYTGLVPGRAPSSGSWRSKNSDARGPHTPSSGARAGGKKSIPKRDDAAVARSRYDAVKPGGGGSGGGRYATSGTQQERRQRRVPHLPHPVMCWFILLHPPPFVGRIRSLNESTHLTPQSLYTANILISGTGSTVVTLVKYLTIRDKSTRDSTRDHLNEYIIRFIHHL